MIDIAEFLLSDVAVFIYISVIVLCGVLLIRHVSKDYSMKKQMKLNTKMLNEEVLDVKKTETKKEEVSTEIKEEVNLEPVTIIENNANLNKEEISVDVNTNINTDTNVKVDNSDNVVLIKNEKKDDGLVYAPIELNKEEAIEELEKITKELTIKAELEERLKNEEIEEHEQENDYLTNFEREQEENAIISIDELMSKANDIYTDNEVLQYEDEGNEPISIDDLKARWEKEKQLIDETLKQDEGIQIIPIEEENNEPQVIQISSWSDEKKEIKQVPFPSILPEKKTLFSNNFESSPIISPVYGLERKKMEEEEKKNPTIISPNELQLENTANYEKFDEEIKKTNEFIAALKELQKKLD